MRPFSAFLSFLFFIWYQLFTFSILVSNTYEARGTRRWPTCFQNVLAPYSLVEWRNEEEGKKKEQHTNKYPLKKSSRTKRARATTDPFITLFQVPCWLQRQPCNVPSGGYEIIMMFIPFDQHRVRGHGVLIHLRGTLGQGKFSSVNHSLM